MDDLPNITRRIKKLIDHFADGNVAEFVRLTKMSSHQVLNRLFSVDKRSGKYPNPSSGILTAIQTHLTDVNHKWLLTGDGNMLTKDYAQEKEITGTGNKVGQEESYKDKLIKAHEETIESKNAQIKLLEEKLKECEGKIFKDKPVQRDVKLK